MLDGKEKAQIIIKKKRNKSVGMNNLKEKGTK